MTRIIVDKFEGAFAVVELPGGIFVNIQRVLLPVETKEGDVIDITVNKEATKKRRERIRLLQEELGGAK